MTEDVKKYEVETEELPEEAAVDTDKEIAIKPDQNYQALSVPDNSTPQVASLIQMKQAGFTVAEIKEMMDLQDRNDKRLAKQAFDKAMAEFKRNPPKIIKDLINTQFGSTYSSIGNVVNTANEAMASYGLNARWEFPPNEDKNTIICTCILAHELGHEVKVTLDGPIDNSGKKNPLQERKSTRTYLKLETFEAVTGIASIAGNLDDDGNSSGQPKSPELQLISESQANKIYSLLDENNLSRDIFLGWLAQAVQGATKIEDMPIVFYKRAVDKINKAIKEKAEGDQVENT